MMNWLRGTTGGVTTTMTTIMTTNVTSNRSAINSQSFNNISGSKWPNNSAVIIPNKLRTTTTLKPGLGVIKSPESGGMSIEWAIALGVGLSLLFVIMVLAIIFGYSRSQKSRAKKSAPVREQSIYSEGDGLLKTHSLLSDLPSTDVQSIVIESKELKPVNSEVFKWKPKGAKPQPKVSPQLPLKRKDDKPKDKLNIKPKDKKKDKKEKREMDNKDKDRKQKRKDLKVAKKKNKN